MSFPAIAALKNLERLLIVGHVPPRRCHAAISQHLALDEARGPEVLKDRNRGVPIECRLRLRPIHQIGQRYRAEQLQIRFVRHPSFDGGDAIVTRTPVEDKRR
jgi:hypothetical protein